MRDAGSGHEKPFQGSVIAALTAASTQTPQESALRSPALLCLVQIAGKRPSLQTLILENLSKVMKTSIAGQRQDEVFGAKLFA